MPQIHPLCPREVIPENQARGFVLETPHGDASVFIVRRADDIYAYYNRCPHTGVNLDWMPGRFLDITGKLIQCATHGALFRIEDGFCIHGPCVNRSLEAIPLRINDGMLEVVLQDGAD